MKILVIGSGGREHALCRHFFDWNHEVYCLPGNVGIQQIAKPLPSVEAQDHEALARLAKTLEIDLTVVGPEQPLAEGVVDTFQKYDLPIFGPTQEAAQLESSKAFAKAFMQRYSIPTAKYVRCEDIDEAKKASKDFLSRGGVVIKPSGLTAGKGVTLCRTEAEAFDAIESMLAEGAYGESGKTIVLEDLLEGVETSILALCDGKTMTPLIPAQDHKALYAGDKGPNTGGMGAYAPTPFVNEVLMQRIRDEVIDPTGKGLDAEGFNYVGVLYFGLMLTAEGPMVLEYNCRFGDPETQAVLPLLDCDLAKSMQACVYGKLSAHTPQWKPLHSAAVVLASGGYPHKYGTGYPITGLESLEDEEGVFVFHAGTRQNEKDQIVTAGGRVLAVTALAPTLDEAVNHAYEVANQIQFEGKYVREDIGAKALN